jgi:ubiquitin carboxyl-terminal hydrolase 4/11/15
VRKKPYIERGELVGEQPTEEQLREMGQKSWDGHRLRNDSVIVDLCQGMYKSTVVCPQCDVVSVTFDPFMDLSVPLPIKQTYVFLWLRLIVGGNIHKCILSRMREKSSRWK